MTDRFKVKVFSKPVQLLPSRPFAEFSFSNTISCQMFNNEALDSVGSFIRFLRAHLEFEFNTARRRA